MRYLSKVVLKLFLLLSTNVYTDMQVQSGNKQNIMIELFSSEGCSSCPPAENWLNNFDNNPNLWTKYIPLAFHVDYWDRLGWKDPFAQHDFTQRQYQYRKNAHTTGVYTPGFFTNSQEWRGWYDRSITDVKTEFGGILSLKVKNETMEIKYAKKGNYQIHVALLGFGLETQVPRGENKGKFLKHNFVVLNMKSYFSKEAILNIPLLKTQTKAKRYALVAWITQNNSMQTLQSVGGWLEDE